MTDKIDLEALSASGFTPGPWYVADGCSWRRIRSHWTSGDDVEVITPYRHNSDGCLDLIAAPGHNRMANLRLAAAAPELLQRTIAAEKQAQSERERADKADAEIARLKERVKELKGALIAKDGIALLAQSNKEG